MSVRTDLVLEENEICSETQGAENEKTNIEGILSSYTCIKNESVAKRLSKPLGKYITLEFKDCDLFPDSDSLIKAIINALERLFLGRPENVLVVGLGNADITPDALGPLTVNKVLATRHIGKELAEELGLSGLRRVSAIAAGVLGKTGIESAEIISAAAKLIKCDAIIAIDALAARHPERLCNTVQLTDTGISPGSGVKNSRRELSRNTVGVPVVAIGVPTVVDISNYNLSASLKFRGEMIVTPKDIDSLILQTATVISKALNIFLQPEIDADVLMNLT